MDDLTERIQEFLLPGGSQIPFFTNIGGRGATSRRQRNYPRRRGSPRAQRIIFTVPAVSSWPRPGCFCIDWLTRMALARFRERATFSQAERRRPAKILLRFGVDARNFNRIGESQ